jgi:uncharacterized protein (UPF0333 family)
MLLVVAGILILCIIWIHAVVVVVVAAASSAAAARMDHIVYSHTPGDGKNGTNVVPVVPHVCWFVRSLFYLSSGADRIYNPSSSQRN